MTQAKRIRLMRKTLGVSLLVLTLFCSARAGDIPSTPAVPPPPPALAADGIIHTGAADSASEAGEMKWVALDLLQSVLSLF